MELNSNDAERFKKIALTATALVVGGAIVKYVHKEGYATGYVYNFVESSGSVLIGLINDSDAEKGVTQFTGKIKDGEFVLNPDSTLSIEPEEIAEFESVFEIAKN